MNRENIIVKNAHTNNLKNIDVEIPKHKLVVFTGISGSGKSSLLFDTIYTEAQRQLIETFSTFARARLPKLSRPDVDDIQNLSTAIVIDQKRMGNNLRSTVGTATEINTYLRLLFSRIGKPYIGPSFLLSFNHPEGMCPHCHGLGKQIQVDINMLLDKEKSIYEGAIIYPGMQVGSWFWRELTSIDLFDVHKKLKDFTEAEINKLLYTEPILINKKHGTGIYSKTYEGIARKLEKSVKGKAEDEAPEEEKDAYKKYIIYSDCNYCNGSRLNERALSVKIKGLSIAGLCALELTEVLPFLSSIDDEIAIPITRKAQFLLEQLIEIGVGYLSLNRSVATLSGGESQRVKMARQLDCNLVDMLYVFLKQYPKAIVIDQSAIGKSSRANPATYTGIFDFIRKEFAQATGADPSLFSFNSKGACPKCNGQGLLSFELHFLDAVKTICDECEGKRYKSDVLSLKYINKSIAEVLDMTVDEAYQFFISEKINKQLKVLQDVGLGYLKIGQSLSSLSGGESQRLKIASELHKVGNIYVMDEPTTGLHMSDIQRLYRIIRSLADKNNTVIVIEHNLDIIKYADWIIDMGPEGGRQGGEVLFQGIPENIVNCVNSYTGKYLDKML